MVGGQQFSTLKQTRVDSFDVATQLRDISEAAVAVTTNGTPNDVLNWIVRDPFKVIIDYVAYSGYVDGVDEWTVSVEAANDSGGTFVEVTSIVLDTSSNRVELPISGEQIDQILDAPTKPALRVVATITGSPGALTYGAFLTRSA